MTQQAVVEPPLESIVANPQVRQQFDAESEKGLAQGMRRHPSAAVRPVDGERRFRAAKVLRLASVVFQQCRARPR